MGLGYSLHDAERIAAFVMTWVIIVVTIMGYRIHPLSEDISLGGRTRIPVTTAGILPGNPGSQYCGFGKFFVDAHKRSPALLFVE